MALWFPRLPTDRLQRREKPAIASPPLVAVAKVKNAMVLQAVDRLMNHFFYDRAHREQVAMQGFHISREMDRHVETF